MEIDIRASQRMSATSEGKVIRIPKIHRDRLGVQLGEFICMKRRDTGIEMLQVCEPYIEDAAVNKDASFVSTDTGNNLLVTSSNDELSVVNNITLGCDPEAILIDCMNGSIIPAHRLMKKQGDVGNDGVLIEFRPDPSDSANEVCFNIWNLIKKARQMLDVYAEGKRALIWGCSSYDYLAAGFHLHFGLPTGLLSGRAGAARVARLMTPVFDYYVGVPSIVPEDNVDVNRRTAKFVNYGKPGGFRLNSKTFEFRLPGGTNLRHPILTMGLMTLGQVVAEDVVSRINTCTDALSDLNEVTLEQDVFELYPNLPNIENCFGIICNPDIGQAMEHLSIIREDVRSMVGYAKKMDVIESYFGLLQSKNSMSFSNNIEHNWGDYYA